MKNFFNFFLLLLTISLSSSKTAYDDLLEWGKNNPLFISDKIGMKYINENTIIKMDKALEINTGGLRKGLSNPNPAKTIIKRYNELGGKMITLGADAHVPDHVAADFEALPELLKDCGFNEFVVFKNRKPEAYPL